MVSITDSPPPFPPRVASLTMRTVALMAVKTIAFGFGFLLPLLLVRTLTKAEFGLYKQAFQFVSTAIVVLPVGFAMSAFYFLPREQERRGAVVFNILLFNAAIGAAVWLGLALYPGMLAGLFGNPDLTPLANLIGLVVLLWIVSSFLEIVAVAYEETALASVFIIAANLTKTTLLVGAALGFGSVTSLLYAAAVQGAVQVATLLWYLESRFPGFWRRVDWGMMRTQISYAIPLGAAGVLFALQNDLHNYFVPREFGVEAFAVYSIGCSALPLIGILGSSVGSVLIPRVSLLQKQGDRREMLELTGRVMRKVSAVYLPLYAFLLVVGPQFLEFLFTAEYVAAWPVFAVVLTLLPIDVFVSDPVLRAHAEQRFLLLRVQIAVFTLVFAALWFGTAELGLVGVIVLVVAANAGERAWAVARSWQVLGATRHDIRLLTDVGKVALAAGAAAAVAYGARAMLLESGPLAVLAGCGAIFTAAYVLALVALRIPTADERDAVRRALACAVSLASSRGTVTNDVPAIRP